MTNVAAVTIVVPVYNHCEYLAECLESVVAQTRSDWEAVVVDDASTVGEVAAVIRGVGDPRVRLVRHDRNRGLAAARNTAVREGRADYVLPLDADDRLEPTFLADAFDALTAAAPCDAVFTDFMAFGVRSGRIRFEVQDVKRLLKSQWIPGAGTLYHRRVWEHAGGYCEADALRPGNEDWDFWVGAAKRPLRVTHVPKPLYGYRQHDTSMVTGLQYHDHLTREFIYQRHRELFDRFGMKNVFLSGGCFCSAKAHWRRREPASALRLGIRSFVLSPIDCMRNGMGLATRMLGRAWMTSRVRAVL